MTSNQILCWSAQHVIYLHIILIIVKLKQTVKLNSTFKLYFGLLFRCGTFSAIQSNDSCYEKLDITFGTGDESDKMCSSFMNVINFLFLIQQKKKQTNKFKPLTLNQNQLLDCYLFFLTFFYFGLILSSA